jgi:flagella basal body P-ring formation protein FlgA
MKRLVTKTWHVLICCLVPICSVGASSKDQTHAEILDAATAFVNTHAAQFAVPPVVVPGRLDSRLQLPRCTQPLEAFEPPNGLKPGRLVVGVRCTGDKPWKLFVPVTVSLPGRVVVASRHLRRGQMIGTGDVELVERNLAALHGAYYEDASRVIGLKLKRDLTRNAVLTPKALEVDRLVRRGSEVTILAADPRIRVSVKGKALGSGAAGDRIKVENLSSGRRLSATVVGRGTVRVPH